MGRLCACLAEGRRHPSFRANRVVFPNLGPRGHQMRLKRIWAELCSQGVRPAIHGNPDQMGFSMSFLFMRALVFAESCRRG